MTSRIYMQVAKARFALTLASVHNKHAVAWAKRGDTQMAEFNATKAARYIQVATEWAMTPEIMRQALASTSLDVVADACLSDCYQAEALRQSIVANYPDTADKLRAAHPQLLL